MRSKAAGAAFAVLALLYPLWVWWGLRHLGLGPVALGLALLALLRWLASRSIESLAAALAAAALAAASLALEAKCVLLLYPVFMNGFMLWLFASSLRKTPFVERLARLKDPELPPEGVRWCRGVTKLWCAFFIVNGLTALATVVIGDPGLWALWNGAASYVLMGLLFAGEWIARRIVLTRRELRK